jgi:hypothetical protein
MTSEFRKAQRQAAINERKRGRSAGAKKTSGERSAHATSHRDRCEWHEFVLRLPKRKGGAGLTDAEKNLASRLFAHFNDETGLCNPSVPTLANGTGQQPRSIFRERDRLKAEGLISWDRTGGRQGGSSSYRLLMKRIWANDLDGEHLTGESGVQRQKHLTRQAQTPDSPGPNTCLPSHPNLNPNQPSLQLERRAGPDV